MSEYTRGPWVVDGFNVVTAWFVYDSEDPPEICHHVIADCNYVGWIDPSVPLANARLIAAAPELLTCLVETLEIASRNEEGEFADRSRAAIAKALGE